MFKFDIVAKYVSGGTAGAVGILDSQGRSCTLFYRLSVLGFSTGWKPVKFVSSFPV